MLRITCMGVVLCTCSAGLASAQAGVPGGRGQSSSGVQAEYFADVIQHANQLMTDWRRAWREDDLDALAEFYTENATLGLPGVEVLHGREAITQHLSGLLPESGEVQTSLLDFDASGRIGYLYGNFSMTATQSDNGSAVQGTVVTIIYRKGRDWLIRSQHFRVAAPPG